MVVKLRLGRRTPNGGDGVGDCDEQCTCIETVAQFSDDFCGNPPLLEGDGIVNTNDNWDFVFEDTDPGAVVLAGIERSTGWWHLEKEGGAPGTVTLKRTAHCWSALQIPPLAGKRATVHYKTRLFASILNNDAGVVLRAGLMNDLQPGPGGLPVGAYFETVEVSPGVFQWRVRIVSPSLGDFATVTNIGVPITCDSAQLLEIILSSAGIRFFIDKVEVAFFSAIVGIPASTVIELLQDVLKAFYQVESGDGIQASMDMDYVCIAMTPRLCVDKVGII